MKIIDLDQRYEPLYCACLEDWSEEMKESGDHKVRWFRQMKDRGLRVKLALDEQDRVGGMIQYVPIEHADVDGRDLYFINCIWVHGHKQGRGNFQGRGMGKALLKAAEADAENRGAKGMAAWGISLPFWMKASWFKRNGYRKADRDGIRVLLWKPFVPDALPPRWIRRRKHPVPEPGKVTVTAFLSGWCPVENIAFERAKRAVAAVGSPTVFREISTGDREVFREWGIADAIYVDDKQIRTGPPPTYEKIKRTIEKKVKKLGNS